MFTTFFRYGTAIMSRVVTMSIAENFTQLDQQRNALTGGHRAPSITRLDLLKGHNYRCHLTPGHAARGP
jgi:hypothetical protein